MSFGGGSKQKAPETPASEIASKEIELKRYDMAQGINQQFMPKYVEESRRDLSHITRGRANADVVSQTGNGYLDTTNPFDASRATSAGANARNTAIIRAHGAAEENKIARTDAALNSINGQVSNASQGLLAQASRESDYAINAAQNSANNSASRMGMVTSVLGAAAGVAYDQYKRDEKIFGLWGGKSNKNTTKTS